MDKHEELRKILIDYNNKEFGDAIIDEISLLFDYPTTTEIKDYKDGWKMTHPKEVLSVEVVVDCIKDIKYDTYNNN